MSNTILAVNENSKLILFDTKSYSEDIKDRLKFVDFFSYVTCAICLILGSF